MISMDSKYSASKEFMRSMETNRERPHDAFAQAHSLLESEFSEVREFSQICEKQIMLANISNDEYMRYVQIDLKLLVHLFDMARRDPGLMPFFLVQYTSIKSELQLTRAKDGLEIKAQHGVASQFKPTGQITGFGNQMNQDMAQVQQQEENLFNKVWNKVRPKNNQTGGVR